MKSKPVSCTPLRPLHQVLPPGSGWEVVKPQITHFLHWGLQKLPKHYLRWGPNVQTCELVGDISPSVHTEGLFSIHRHMVRASSIIPSYIHVLNQAAPIRPLYFCSIQKKRIESKPALTQCSEAFAKSTYLQDTKVACAFHCAWERIKLLPPYDKARK